MVDTKSPWPSWHINYTQNSTLYKFLTLTVHNSLQKYNFSEINTAPLMGTALAWQWGLWAPRILQIPHFKHPERRRLLRVPQFGPQNPAYRGAEISRDPVQSMCSQGILVVPLLASILRSWHRSSWNWKWLVYLWYLCQLQLFSRLTATPVVVGSLVSVPPGDHFLSSIPNGMGEKVMSKAQETRSFISWNFFSA